MELLLVVFIFIAVVLLIEGIFLLFRSWWNPEVRRVKTQLRQLSLEEYGQGDIDLVRRRLMSDIPWFNRFLVNLRAPLVGKLDRMVLQANLPYPVGVVLMASFVLTVLGFGLASFVSQWFLVRVALGLIMGVIPFLYVQLKRGKRIKRFEEQLPDAMEMLARSLKAGHAFTGGLQMVGQEFDDPIGTEFSKTVDEINFGVGYEDALRNLSSRIESDDLKLFVISVIIQRTSGGNLAEILDNIGRLVRERFKLKGNIRTLTAEGRISAYVLIALPFIIGYVMYLLNPDYISILFTDPIGHFLLMAAAIMMMVGAYVMKRMVEIKV
jgi:tight adherence protein B